MPRGHPEWKLGHWGLGRGEGSPSAWGPLAKLVWGKGRWRWAASRGEGGAWAGKPAGCQWPPQPWEPGDLFVFCVKGKLCPLCDFCGEGAWCLPALLPGFPAIDTDADNEREAKRSSKEMAD